jgi:hypothetical protein
VGSEQAAQIAADRDVAGHLPLVRLLWADYGREGRVVAAVALGPMELAAPEQIVPVIQELARIYEFSILARSNMPSARWPEI